MSRKAQHCRWAENAFRNSKMNRLYMPQQRNTIPSNARRFASPCPRKLLICRSTLVYPFLHRVSDIALKIHSRSYPCTIVSLLSYCSVASHYTKQVFVWWKGHPFALDCIAWWRCLRYERNTFRCPSESSTKLVVCGWENEWKVSNVPSLVNLKLCHCVLSGDKIMATAPLRPT